MPKGYLAVKRALIAALAAGRFQHETRGQIGTKNLLQSGLVSAIEVEQWVARSNGSQYACRPDHRVPSVDVHILITQGWYLKFYFVGDPDVVFISVHRAAQP